MTYGPAGSGSYMPNAWQFAPRRSSGRRGRSRKPLTQAQIARRAVRSSLTGRAARLGRSYPPARPAA